MRPENLKNDTKFDELIKNSQLPVGFGILLQETFLQVLVCYMSVPIFIHVRETQLEAHTVESVQVALSSHFATPTFETHIRCKFSPLLGRVQSFVTFRACLGPQKCDSFRRRIIIIIKAASSNERALAPGLNSDRQLQKHSKRWAVCS